VKTDVKISPFKYLDLDFARSEYTPAPYPCFVFQQVFSQETVRGLRDEFPEALLAERARVAGGRFQLPNGTSDFYRFLDRSRWWRNVYQEFNSKAFSETVLDAFQKDIVRHRPLFEISTLKFDPTLFERQANMQSVTLFQTLSQRKLLVTGSKDIAQFVLVREYLRWRSMSDKVLRLRQFDVALSFDISIAHDGYTREVHRDSDSRIAAMVVYLDDFSAGEGGTFLVHEHKLKKSMDEYEPQPSPCNVVISKEYRPRANLGLLFLNVPNAYHSVPVIRNSRGFRKFFYLGISLVGKKAWKNQFRFDYNRFLS
jgi:hypothetical protein